MNKGNVSAVSCVGLTILILQWSCGGADRQAIDAAVDLALDALLPDAVVDAQTAAAPGIDSASGTRLVARREAYRGADGTKYDTGRTLFFDSVRNEDCSLDRMSDGQLHCLPKATIAASLNLFSDAACTQALAYSPIAGCQTPAAAYYAEVQIAACGTSEKFVRRFEVGAPYLQTNGYSNASGSCVATSLSTNNRYYLLGAELMPVDFVPFVTAP